MRGQFFPNKYGPWALVAGASEGIGATFARELAAKGLNLVLIARRREPLEVLKRELLSNYDIDIKLVQADLGASELPDRLGDIKSFEIGLLVYNASFSPISSFLDISLTEHRQTLQVNCTGPRLRCSIILASI